MATTKGNEGQKYAIGYRGPGDPSRTAPRTTGQDSGNGYGGAAEAFSEGPLLVPLPGPKTAWDTNQDRSTNDDRDTGWKAETASAAPQSKNDDADGIAERN